MNNEFEADIHTLELRYASTRLLSASMIEEMRRSIDLSGQIKPLIVIRGEQGRYVLVDGYLRLASLKQMARDVARIVVWDCDESAAIITVLCSSQSRSWAAIEEARMINLLIREHSCSQSGVARMIGRNVSWVHRRLALIEGMDESIQEAVCNSQLSTWSASRVIAPLARAKGDHALKMLRFLEHDPLSTRELATWNKYYQRANKVVREQMVNDPKLFLAALNNKEREKEAQTLRDGLEGAWLKDIQVAKAMLQRQRNAISALFSSPHNAADQESLRAAFSSLRELVEAMQQEMVHS